HQTAAGLPLDLRAGQFLLRVGQVLLHLLGLLEQLLHVGLATTGEHDQLPSSIGRFSRSARAYVVAAGVAAALFRVSRAGTLYLIKAPVRAEKRQKHRRAHPFGRYQGSATPAPGVTSRV